jgi:hypothetical protein
MNLRVTNNDFWSTKRRRSSYESDRGRWHSAVMKSLTRVFSINESRKSRRSRLMLVLIEPKWRRLRCLLSTSRTISSLKSIQTKRKSLRTSSAKNSKITSRESRRNVNYSIKPKRRDCNTSNN